MGCLTFKLLKKISHSPLAVTELPIEGYTEDTALMVLYRLEDLGILSSYMRKVNDKYIRVFRKTWG